MGCKDHWPGALVFSSETRHRYSEIPPSGLDTGTVGGTIVSFGAQDFSLVQMYWEQGSCEDGLLFRVGEMDPALIWDGGRYVSSNYAFLSPAFSDTLPMALPGAGLGVAGAVYPTQSTYIAAGIHDANGNRTTAGFDTFFGEGEYFTAVEFGLTPNYGEPHAGMYHVTLWNIDARQNAGRPSDRGVALTLEQQVGCDGSIVPFLRYAYAHRGLNGIRQNLSIGLGIEDVFGQNDDVVGVATSWEEPSNRSLSEQYVVEAFYRFHITPHTHLTPDIQVVIDPANAPSRNAVTVFGLRLRTLF
jgi:porin